MHPCLDPLFLSEIHSTLCMGVDIESEFFSKVSNIDVLVTNDWRSGFYAVTALKRKLLKHKNLWFLHT